MSATLGVHGVEPNADLNINWVRADTRPFMVKMSERIGGLAPLIYVLIGLSALFFPASADFIFLGGSIFFLIANSKRRKAPLATPEHRNWLGMKRGKGIIVLGRDMATNMVVAQDDDTARQHYLALGTTGSGKSRFMVSMVFCALLYNSGALIIDGKGDTATFWLIYRICRRLDRTDDLLIVNFLNGGKESGGNPSPVTRLSNTNNSWASATSDMITEMLAGMMPGGGGDAEYWRGRARTMVSSLIRLLVDMRSRGEVALGVQTLRDWMPLAKLMELAKRQDFDDHRKAGLLSYLMDLGIQEADFERFGTPEQQDFAPKVVEQHGYLQQQLTQVLGELGDTYRHIFGVNYGEVHWPTVLFKRKIVFVLLPVLEKSPDTISGLGRLVFSGLRTALAPALGDKLEGTHDYVMSRKIADSDVPMYMFFDEWGNYASIGAAAIVSQVRGLGVSCWFMTQDEPGMRKDEALDREASSIIGNCNTKICMRIEEMKHTYELFQLRGGKAHVNRRQGSEYKGNTVSGSYHDSGSTTIEHIDRIDPRDLVSQEAGQAHVTIGDNLLRMQVLYIDPPPMKYARINQWLDCLPSNAAEYDKFRAGSDALEDFFDKDKFQKLETALRKYRPTEISPILRSLKESFQQGMRATGGDGTKAGIIAVGLIDHKASIEDAEHQEMVERSIHGIVSPPEARTDNLVPEPIDSPESSDAEDSTGGSPTAQETEGASTDFATQTQVMQKAFTEGLEATVSQSLRNLTGYTAEERETHSMSAQIEKGGRLLDIDNAQDDAAKGMRALKDSTPDYPKPPTPRKKTEGQVADCIEEARRQIALSDKKGKPTS